MKTEDRERKLTNILETYFSDANLLWDKDMQEQIKSDPDGFVPLKSLCKRPKFKALDATETEVATVVDEHSSTRLKLNSDRTAIARIKPFVLNKKEELDAWSIYVEGLRPPHHTEASIKELIRHLVGPVTFFRIPQDRNGNVRFEGHCFIEFGDQDHVVKAIKLLNQYPHPDSDQPSEATELNLRVMSKIDWLRYRDEYLEHLESCKGTLREAWNTYHATEQEKQTIYPKGVVVVVTNIHPKTSKTVLKQLLEKSGASVEFINFKKGMITSHVRLTAAQDTQCLVDYFTTHHIIQENGTDATGKPTNADDTLAFGVREIKGKEEAIYWENDERGLKMLMTHGTT